MAVRLWKVQVMIEGSEETAIAAFWVNDRVVCCRVGFLPRHMDKHAVRNHGSLTQVTHVFIADPTCCDSAEWQM